jgi:hypothetical protein
VNIILSRTHTSCLVALIAKACSLINLHKMILASDGTAGDDSI